MTSPAPTQSTLAKKSATKNSRRSAWLKTLHQWHWISSALCLLGILLFSFTGITLNHAAQIESHPKVTMRRAELPPALLNHAKTFAVEHAGATELLPAPLLTWLDETLAVRVGDKTGEWSAEELYIAMPRPGGDAWLRIDLIRGSVEYEVTDRGWIAWLNDLHKGRHTGDVWMWFIDIFAAGCLMFSITGLLILKFHATNRPLTWPIVGLGILIPLLLALLFIH
jgi:uncharacterized protein